MISNYLKVAWRNLSRTRIYSFINIVGLSLGLACAMLLILYVKDDHSYDLFHQKGPRIYRVVNRTLVTEKNTGKILAGAENGGLNAITSYVPGPKFKAGIPEIESFLRLQHDYMDMKKGSDVSTQEIISVDSNFFGMFSFPLLKGNPATALLDPSSVVISEDIAKKQFGTFDALGKILELRKDGDFKTYRVTGIAKNCPQNSSIRFDILLPLIVPKDQETGGDAWFSSFLNTFVVLSPKAEAKRVQPKMNLIYQAETKDALKMAQEKYQVQVAVSYMLQPFTDIHLSQQLPGMNGLADSANLNNTYILSGIALFVLLIACSNFVNLTLARSIKRAKEIGVRKAIGGGRKQLMLQFIGESFLLCLLAFFIAIVLAQMALPLFNSLSRKELSLSYLLDARLVFGYICLFSITIVLAGFYPSVVLSGFHPAQTLYGRFQAAGKNYLQKFLVVFQFTLASFLIAATLVLFYQFNFLTTENLGYDDSSVVYLNRYSMKLSEVDPFKQELLKNKDILNVAVKNSGYDGTAAKINGDSIIQFAIESIDETFLPLLKIPIVQGRNFSSSFPSDSSNSVLVNESFVQRAGWKNPLGQTVDFWNRAQKYQVVGVVKDYHNFALTTKIGPQLFTMKSGKDYGRILIRIRPKSETSTLKYIESTFKSVFPLVPYNYEFADEVNRRQYESEARWKKTVLFGAVLTICISCIGLFGLSVLSAEKRTKEVGIRKVLGATNGSIVTVLSKDFLKLIAVALLLALPAAWIAAERWLQNYPYRIALTVWMFGAVGLCVIVLAMATISFQAIKTAITNPVQSLRTE